MTDSKVCITFRVGTLNKPVMDDRYIAVMLDGLFFYLRRETVDKEPVIFALGIKESGEYEILGFYLTPMKNLYLTIFYASMIY